MSSHKKYKNKCINYTESSSEEITFTKIKKIYKCGICNKKIKNYCKCISASIPHSGSNIITIMTNPESEKKLTEPIIQKGEKGLTGSMGLQGNSFIIFSTSTTVKSGDFIGIGVLDQDFYKTCIVIPYDFYIKHIGFTHRNQIKYKCTAILYINNKPSDYSISICDGLVSTKSFNSFTSIKSSDMLSFCIMFESGILPNGICINMVIN